MSRCRLCRRRLLPWNMFRPWAAWRVLCFAPGHPLVGRMDCGGDCLRCIDKSESVLR